MITLSEQPRNWFLYDYMIPTKSDTKEIGLNRKKSYIFNLNHCAGCCSSSTQLAPGRGDRNRAAEGLGQPRPTLQENLSRLRPWGGTSKGASAQTGLDGRNCSANPETCCSFRLCFGTCKFSDDRESLINDVTMMMLFCTLSWFIAIVMLCC